MAQAFAGQVAIAIENARLYQEVQRDLAERKQADEGSNFIHPRFSKSRSGGFLITKRLPLHLKAI